jgi:hypothetical protein
LGTELVLFAYNWTDEVKDDVMGRACNTYGDKQNACRILVGKPEGKRQLGRLRHRWEDNIMI